MRTLLPTGFPRTLVCNYKVGINIGTILVIEKMKGSKAVRFIAADEFSYRKSLVSFSVAIDGSFFFLNEKTKIITSSLNEGDVSFY